MDATAGGIQPARRSERRGALTPTGVRDWLPEEAGEKRALERRIRELFAGWGYGEVITPSLEFEHVVEQRAGGSAPPFYRLMDREGETLALRSEITPSVARVAATRLRAEPAPLRLGYMGRVFRHDEPRTGRMREFTQAGVELIGVSGPAADAEVVALAAAVFDAAGLSGYHIDIGHAGFCAGLLNGMVEDERAIRSALLRRDFVALAALVESAQPPPEVAELITAFDSLRGGIELLEYAAERAGAHPKALGAIEELTATYRHIEAYGLADRVSIDLGLAKDVEYYTGMVLEGYSEEVGYTLCTGGRYDHLIERFGAGRPATGVALGVERLLLARERSRRRPEHRESIGSPSRKLAGADVLALVPGDGSGLMTVRRWRREGLRIAVELIERPIAETIRYGRRLGARYVVRFEAGSLPAGEAVLYDLTGPDEDGIPNPTGIDPATWDGGVGRGPERRER